jgi:anthranilate synthase component 1
LFYFNFGTYKVAGSSPEMLVEMKNNHIKNCPIAGTRKRGKNEVEDKNIAVELINDPKEKAEHVMLVDLARNDMGKIAKVGSVEVTDFMSVHNYSHVMHIVSLVEGEKEEKETAFSVLASFLPAGTLSGAPKIRAMEIIDELEKVRRGIYGGAVGYFSFDGNMDTCIAIRTMVIKDEKIYMQAGAGLTINSVPELEYEECLNKVKVLIEALGGSYDTLNR